MQTVTELLSESKRKVMYIAYGLIGVVLGATQTAFTAAEATSPLWLVVSFSVYLYVGGAFGLVAAQNVGSQELIIDAPTGLDYRGSDSEVDTYLGQHGTTENIDEVDVPETVDLTDSLLEGND